ncbi:MAG: hypothetical protein PHU93_01085 [Candidatus Gracilibacteria bacterium]|nr:hypothetical protein [Candidatus Gracilibacteria bacterium]
MVKNLNTLIDTIELSNGISIGIVPGKLSDNDIIIKYKDKNGTQHWRQPKHIHWIVDWMLKREHDEQAIRELVIYFSKLWKKYNPTVCQRILKALLSGNRSLESVYLIVKYDIDIFANKLDRYGYYKVDFLIFFGFLLLLQEKNNRNDAYMFEKMFSALAKDYSELYNIISYATSNYGKK